MIWPFKKSPKAREIYFHEDDYCQQQLLPSSKSDVISQELNKVAEFSKAHQAPEGLGWTDVYVREALDSEFGDLGMNLDTFDRCVSHFLQKFDNVFTGYSSYREVCRMTGAWGLSDSCCIFADWNDAKVVQHVWTSFFDAKDECIQICANTVKALSSQSPLIYVDWAWDYACDASNEKDFIRLLADKTTTIENNRTKRT